MNRENKRKKYDKHYYKNHACTDSFTCKVCGRPVVAPVQQVITAIIAQTAFRAYILTTNLVTAQQTAAALWIPSAFGYARTVNGPSSIAAVAAVILVQTVSPPMTIL